MKLVSKFQGRRQLKRRQRESLQRIREEREMEDHISRLFVEEAQPERVYLRDIIGCDRGLKIAPAKLPGGMHPAKKVLLDYRHPRMILWPPTPEEVEEMQKLALEGPTVSIITMDQRRLDAE